MTTEPEETVELDTTVELDAETRARLARLQARRSATGTTGASTTAAEAAPASGRRRRRPHPAKDSRIAATAFGLSAMFGLIAAYGVAAHAAGPELTEIPAPTPAMVEPIVIQVRLVGLDGTPVAAPGSTTSASGPVPAAEQAPTAVASAAPVAAAAPEVRVLTAPSAPAPAAPAPVVEASTNGSR